MDVSDDNNGDCDTCYPPPPDCTEQEKLERKSRKRERKRESEEGDVILANPYTLCYWRVWLLRKVSAHNNTVALSLSLLLYYYFSMVLH